ncbi:MAG: discoidin domain-containing protein [bacterium]
MKKILCMLLFIFGLAHVSADAAEGSVQSPSTWWVIGAIPRYTQGDFKANENIENAGNNDPKHNQWNGQIGLGGRDMRGLWVPAQAGAVDLAAACGSSYSNACAYVGFRVGCEKAAHAVMTLRAPGTLRCFVNNTLVGEGEETVKVNVAFKSGMNAVLVKSWNNTGSLKWTMSASLESKAQLSFESGEPVAMSEKPAPGKRNVALWSEGAKIETSSFRWGGMMTDRTGRHCINDGQKTAPAWSSLAQQNLPQWVWVKFAGPRTIDRVVLYAGKNTRDFTGEYSPDGGATFKPLFQRKDEKPGPQLSYTLDFKPVVTDNVRIRITRVEKSETSGFDVAQVAEVEVYGEGAGSVVDTPPAKPSGKTTASIMKPDLGFVPEIKEDATQWVLSTPWYRLNLDKARPRLTYLSLDATGQGAFLCNVLKNAGAFLIAEPMFAPVQAAGDGQSVRDGNVVTYPFVTVAPGVFVQVAFRFKEKSIELELSTAAKRALPLRAGLFRFDLDFRQTPTSLFPRAEDPSGFVTFPAYMHAPDCGTFRMTQTGDKAVFRQVIPTGGHDLGGHCMVDIVPEATGLKERYGVIPEGTWRGVFTFAVDPLIPWPEIVGQEPRLKGLPKYALNIAQWRVDQSVLANNIISQDCPLSLQFYAEMAVYAPVMKDNISPMALVVTSVDRYLDGLGGHLMWHGLKVEVTPPGKWYASLESGGFLLNSAWTAVNTVGGQPLLKRWLPRLEALAGHLEAHDIDGDGIVESGDRGHWFDNYKLPEGVKEAHSTAVNYEAFVHMAQLEELAGRKEKAAHYQKRAQLIKDNYLKTFYNPETGVIGGWRDVEGKLRDRMFPWINGYAICAGLVPDELANQILDRLFAKMKEIGFTQFQYGLPTNLLPMGKDEMSHGYREWEGYMNGSITPPYSGYVIQALYKLGRRQQAEEVLWPQVASFDKGTFNAGIGICGPRRNPVGSGFYYWDGTKSNGIGYLPENWHAYAEIFAGHYGIRFDKNGYCLEPWSPLKGKTLTCNMQVMGKIQKTME